jgi:hypothetical protein
VSREQLLHLVEAGQIPPLTAAVEWKVTGDESVLHPQGVRGLVVGFHERGFSVPVGRFIRGVLFEYRLQLQHLNLNIGRCVGRGAVESASCRYVDFPGIRIIDLDTPELSSNDREMLEVATEQMFADPLILDTITSVVSALHQDEGAGSLAPPATSEAAEGVLEESEAGTESVVIVPPPTSTGEGMGASLPQLAEAVTAAPTAPVVGTAEVVVKGVGPSSPRPVAAAAEEVLVLSQPATASQEGDAPEGTTRAASPRSRMPRRAWA